MRFISIEQILRFENFLTEEEKAPATVEKYIRDIKAFQSWLSDKEVSKSLVMEYKKYLSERYFVASVNSVISSLNCFFTYLKWFDLKIRAIKLQRSLFSADEKELTKSEYQRLLTAAKSKKNEHLYLLIQTICSTGIRVSELRHITVDA